MFRSKLENFYFSQSSLNVFYQCRLKFKKRYIDGLYWSRKELLGQEQIQAMEDGILFHLLAQRYFSGLPTGIQELSSSKLGLWLKRLEALFPLDHNISYLPEYQLRINHNGVKAVAKYDLICLDNKGKITIYDWKTDKKELNKEKIVASWQTILYRYLLIKAGKNLITDPLNLSQVKMIYWNPIYPSKLVELPYSEELYEQDRQAVAGTVEQILSLKEREFLATDRENVCRSCEYSYICQRGQLDYSYLLGEECLEEDFNWEEIQEYPY